MSSGAQSKYLGKLDNNHEKAADFWFDEVDQKILTFKNSINCNIMKSCQGDLEN